MSTLRALIQISEYYTYVQFIISKDHEKKLGSVIACCLVMSGSIYLGGCDDDSEPQLTGDSKTYDLSSVSNPSVSGTATFAEREDDMVVITIQLNGTSSGGVHPSHIHANTAAESGGIILGLTDVMMSNERGKATKTTCTIK